MVVMSELPNGFVLMPLSPRWGCAMYTLHGLLLNGLKVFSQIVLLSELSRWAWRNSRALILFVECTCVLSVVNFIPKMGKVLIGEKSFHVAGF